MFEIFTTREIAIGIWLFVFTVWVFSLDQMPSMIGNLVRTACSWPILAPFLVLTLYVCGLVFALYHVGYWDAGLLKTTVIWFLTIACVSFFRTPTIANDEHYLRNTIKDNIKVIVAIQFVVNFFPLPFWMELITVPVIAFFAATKVFSETKPEYASATSFLSGVLVTWGLVLLTYSAYKLVVDFDSFAQFGTFKDFLLPFLLSFALLPFTITFAAVTKYQTAFGYQVDSIIEDKWLRRYAKCVAVVRFHLRTKFLQRWTRDIRNRPPKTRTEVRAAIGRLIHLDMREKNPPTVNFSDGWSPYRAREVFKGNGIIPDDYHEGYIDGSWSASRLHKEITRGVYPCNVSYYITGKEFVANELKLLLNVNATESQEEALQELALLSTILFQFALCIDLEEDLFKKITSGIEFSFNEAGKEVVLSREEWPSGTGRSFTFLIRNAALDRTDLIG
ncbi:hypothetical protein [Herbaspirillum sp. C9C3]|uniref:hypothetical protein n=1 Tax=Herbaspirillum sp. C9C3 TaxID=2735271 RepID=UPI001585595B|nr:hypothetical protein [Herbaspirillum sp. C9C3]NUT60141.1 hypothetical protein [Herbaspirillum sp. C9C3]